MSIVSINPTTGQQLKIFPTLTDDVLRAKIIESERVFQGYRQTAWAEQNVSLVVDLGLDYQAFFMNPPFSRIFPRLVPPTAMNFLAPWRCYLQYPI